MRGGETHIQLTINPSGAGFWFRMVVHEEHILWMGINPGLGVSLLTPSMQEELLTRGFLQSTGRTGRYRLTDLSVDEQPLPDLEVRISRRLARLGVDGMIGLDLLLRYEHVHLHIPTLHLMLQNPTNGHLQAMR